MEPQELMLASTMKDIDLSKYGNEWVMEEKFDGIRIQTIKEGDNIRMFSRNTGVDGDWMEYTHAAQEIVEELRMSDFDFHIDGEMIYENDKLTGEECFSKLCSRLRTKYQTESLMKEIPLTYKRYDILALNGLNMKNQSYKTRFHCMESFKLNNSIVYDKYFQIIYDDIISKGKEGCVLKRVDSIYECKRTKNWLKVLPEHTEDYNVVGFTKGTGRRIEFFGALICELPSGKTFNVGSGYDDEMLKNIRDNWLGKKFVIEVSYKGLHPSGIPRMPVFQRLRFDKVIKSNQMKLW